MYKIISIVGARPQFIKTAALCRVIRNDFSKELNHIILHTGQHYDKNMSDVFFDELEVDTPTYNLGIQTNASSYPMQTSVAAIEKILKAEKPDMVLVYGDTYSTLAGAIAAENCNLPLAHIEAGMRSFNDMPEEKNRVETDKRATYLFCPTQTSANNLQQEGFSLDTQKPYSPNNKKISLCGDVMYDNALFFKNKDIALCSDLQQLLQEVPSYVLTTIHRQHNTDNKERLRSLIQGLLYIADYKQHILFPIHPRTRKMLLTHLTQEEYNTFISNKYIHCINPLSFFEMMYVEKQASLIITDSGGVQKEAFFYQKPCIIVRSETEWLELITHKCSILTDTEPNLIVNAYQQFTKNPPTHFPPIFGDGNAAHYICKEIIDVLKGE